MLDGALGGREGWGWGVRMSLSPSLPLPPPPRCQRQQQSPESSGLSCPCLPPICVIYVCVVHCCCGLSLSLSLSPSLCRFCFYRRCQWLQYVPRSTFDLPLPAIPCTKVNSPSARSLRLGWVNLVV
ncbi:hypothetical protein ASPZODRAFT_214905 [Penicilliopsis zonata CBS 506.65]|uniref:Uncharacterized protein n=1 Tax=Penicilliopsis zonata CBS 506.65 TaxID=1073090 RepID=A0A1L9STQ6_9EURO|nr:hypothetical protein ASPZODRAFT_214905 [Penicilliopsis zonata CBS 506.65]OJJ50590.1 hypothetical protein ASPZODRAFT_214905 [Penicilliopsis zonata CBS 506.65]